MKLSIVTTLYCSEKYIEEFCTRIERVARGLSKEDFEIILVNDGSPDNSYQIARNIALSNPKVKLINLSKNFGHYKAIHTGLEYSSGEIVFLIDSDLEEPPELLEEFYTTMQNEKCDVVYGVQISRKGKFFERVSGTIYYKLFNWLTKLNVSENVITARLMNRNYLDGFLKFRESNYMIFGIFQISGYNQVPHYIKKGSFSPTTYNLAKKIKLMVDSIISFTSSPLRLIAYTGFVISFFSFFYIAWLLVNYFYNGTSVSGWNSIIASIWFLGGVTQISIGMIGLYISKIFTEVKNRPMSIIKEIIE